MNYSYNIGDTIWHGCRYWKQDDLGPNEVSGWNSEFDPYEIVRLTPKRIIVQVPRSGYPEVHLDRVTMEQAGAQYHSRFSEYFFARRPNIRGDYIGMSLDAIQASFEQKGSNLTTTRKGRK